MKAKLLNVEAGRGVAAILVVLYHVDKYYFGTEAYWQDWALGRFFKFGYSGVEFFFVLSGFIMTIVHWDELGKNGKVLNFLKKRFIRLYPFYWICLSITLLLLFIIPGIGQEKNRYIGNIISSFFLVGKEPLNAVIFVSWTLFHEVVFYAIFALAIFKPKLGIPTIITWTLVCFLMGITDTSSFYMISYINVLFLIGVACALTVKKWTIPYPTIIAFVGAAIFLGTGIDANHSDEIAPTFARILSYGLGSAAFLIGSVEAERLGHWAAPKFMATLGAASYSIYLTHMLSLTFLAKSAVMLGLPPLINPHVAMILLASAATVTGVAIHFTIEKPVLHISRSALEAWTKGGRPGRSNLDNITN